jgi:very-short-patch-repair endonuclease
MARLAMKDYASPKQIARARDLRISSTDVEKKLWHRLRDRQLLGCKFRRQQPFKNYFLDFVCEEQKLVIELDGGQHNEAANLRRDAVRTASLEEAGWKVLRFWNNEVNENIEGVLEVVAQALTHPRALTRNHEV